MARPNDRTVVGVGVQPKGVHNSQPEAHQQYRRDPGQEEKRQEAQERSAVPAGGGTFGGSVMVVDCIGALPLSHAVFHSVSVGQESP